MPAAPIERCIRASELCVAACEAALAADHSYTSPGTERYSEKHLTLLSCASVCTLVTRALRRGDADLDLLRWCVQVCVQCAGTQHPNDATDREGRQLAGALRKCAEECSALMEWIAQSADQAIGASRDTDFQLLPEH